MLRQSMLFLLDGVRVMGGGQKYATLARARAEGVGGWSWSDRPLRVRFWLVTVYDEGHCDETRLYRPSEEQAIEAARNAVLSLVADSGRIDGSMTVDGRSCVVWTFPGKAGNWEIRADIEAMIIPAQVALPDRIEAVEPQEMAYWRKRAKLSQTEAAALVGVDRVTWWRWETGQVSMPGGLFELFLVRIGSA